MDTSRLQNARSLVDERFPEATGALLAGSSVSGRATPNSDLDIAVLVSEPEPIRRETIRHHGQLAELFIHTRTGLARLFTSDRTNRRASMQFMYAEGRILFEHNDEATDAKATAARDLQRGPDPLDEASVETGRYHLTDTLDDLTDSHDDIERLTIAAAGLTLACNLLCNHHRAWTGTGKWLPRRARTADPHRATVLFNGYQQLVRTNNPNPLIIAATDILNLTGGAIREGYQRTWPT
jgi:predicted nucleotidyltransferase